MGSCGAVQERAGREQPERPHASESLARPYRRHEAERTVLYQIVSEHLETFLDEVHSHYDKPLPAYVEKELREFMKCGLLPYGFLRARCKRCGNELLVALSCKRRGVCCSCNARRMCATAAHLTDRVVCQNQIVRESCGIPVVVLQDPTEPLPALDRPIGVGVDG